MTPRERLWAYENFEAFVRAKLRGRSLAQIALRSGVDKSTVSRIASGHRQPTLRTVKAIIDGFAR